ncbi:MAG: ABC transporter ATP-binding protein [Oscillospiraceae bacterium]|nr:ABC transporter ATP-binding protein [Oscillospiraceae bacterium]
MIELKNISKEFKNKRIFSGVNITVETGKCVGIIGENGCGKSVLMKLICGFSKPDSGEVIIDGEKLGEHRDFIQNCGVIINSPDFIGHYTGFENLMLLASIRKKIGKIEVLDVLKKVGLDAAAKTKYKNYSLGMKQRLRLAQAIMENPDYLILDEPMNALDTEGIAIADSIINEYHSLGRTILITSHNANDLERHCDYVLKVENGSVYCI